MESIKNMYFSDTIKPMHYNRIRKQLESGNAKMKRDIHPIVMRIDGDNLFQFLELQEYLKICEISDSYLLLGAVTGYTEFTQFVEKIINECLDNGISIIKSDILNYLINDYGVKTI